LRSTPQRGRIGLVLLSGVLAVLVGFFAFAPHTLESLIRFGGYYYIAAVFGIFGTYAWRVAASRQEVWRSWLRRPGVTGLALLAASLFVLWSDPFKHKVLFDEYVLQGTAFQMHAVKEYGTLVRAYEIAGTWVSIDSFTDKRPYFFTFLVSLVHDFTGYRQANIFLVNVALTPIFLALAYWLARTLTTRGPALLAVGLLATLPLLGQNATGAGMELHNLTMLALVAALAVLYLRAPDEDRLVALVLGAVLLSQSRYESVIFVAPVALIAVIGWVRAGRLLLPWPVIIAPLLLIPYAWHNRVLSATPLLWQLQDGQTSRFSTSYLANNLSGAWSFFFSFSGKLANSWYLSALGGIGGVWLIVRAWCWARTTPRAPLSPGVVALLAFAAGVIANLTVLMFYYWSRLDDVIASRFALPTCLLLALLAAVCVDQMRVRGRALLWWAGFGLVGWLLIGALPAMARRLYTDENIVMQEVEWEHAVLASRPGPLLFITNKSTIPYLLWHIPAVLNTLGRQRAEQIRYHLGEGTFREVIVAQGLRPTSARGEMGIDPNDILPPEFHLETLSERRFGGRWSRISKVTMIDAPRTQSKSSGSNASLSIVPDAVSLPRLEVIKLPTADLR
jgi:hypothetical protein